MTKDIHIFIHSTPTRDTLQSGKSPAAFSHNVKTEVEAGKPQKQAVAIAYSKQRESHDSFEESKHPRASNGQFGSGGGAAKARIGQKLREREPGGENTKFFAAPGGHGGNKEAKEAHERLKAKQSARRQEAGKKEESSKQEYREPNKEAAEATARLQAKHAARKEGAKK